MSILIKGMEMPKNCMECPIVVCLKTKDDCPLISVPPHGRLCDMDSKTFPTPHRNPSNDYMRGWNACLRSVQQQPIIIPSDMRKEQT